MAMEKLSVDVGVYGWGCVTAVSYFLLNGDDDGDSEIDDNHHKEVMKILYVDSDEEHVNNVRDMYVNTWKGMKTLGEIGNSNEKYHIKSKAIFHHQGGRSRPSPILVKLNFDKRKVFKE